MLTYDLKVGYACNNRCKHCVIEDSKDQLVNQHIKYDLTTEECLSQIDFAVKQGAKFIVLTGGEVTIRSDFPILMDRCLETGLDVTIQTNGRRLKAASVADSIIGYPNVRCLVALHGSTSRTHDAITQVQGSFDETCEGVRYMINNNVLTIFKVVISKINLPELVDMIRLAASLGEKYICFAFPHGQGGARKNFAEIIPTYSQLKPILKQMCNVAKNLNVNIEFEAIPFCIIPYAMYRVGELKYLANDTLCTQVKEETFDWDKVRKSIKKKSHLCEKCDMNDFCEGVWSEYADAFGTSELLPIKFLADKKNLIIQKVREKFC